MKNRVYALALSLGLLGVAGLSAQATNPPAGAAGVKVGIINIQRAIVESNEGKAAAEKLQSQFSPRRNELQAAQGEVEKLQKQLREQEKTLSDEARANLMRQIETKSKDFNRKTEDATNEFQQAEAGVINEIGQKMMKVLDEFARKNGYHVVLDVSNPQSPVLWASSAVDVTDEIIKIFNAAHPAAAAPATGAAAPAAPGGTTAPPAARPAANPPPAAAKPAAKKPGQ